MVLLALIVKSNSLTVLGNRHFSNHVICGNKRCHLLLPALILKANRLTVIRAIAILYVKI